MLRHLPVALAIALIATPALASDPRGPVYHQAPPMNAVVSGRVTPQVEALLSDLMADGRGYRLDGVGVFSAEDKFLPGKIAIAMAHVIVATPRDDPDFQRYLAGFRQLSDLTLEDVNDTWGIYYYVSALNELRLAGLLDQAVEPGTLARLRERLDWRTFVRSDLTLIDLPNNYYGVAFSIARLRYLLGWEDASGSEALLTRTLDHYRRYSGAYGFADETDGQGRFDRYSVLLIGEIAQRFIETGVEPPAEVRQWLRASVDVLLPRFNLRGEGFEYGRSIGVYGETAFLEVLSAAAALDVLTDEEKAMAYAFSSRVAARYADFWLDAGTGSVNMWDHGRKTDNYRGKHRILGENLSLAHQLTYTNALWNRLGYRDAEPAPGFEAWLAGLPRSTTTWFSRDGYDRLLVTYRDGGRVIGLPVINGGPTQHMNTPYFPVPFSPGVLAGAADETWPHLIPRLTLADGQVLMPLAFFAGAAVEEDGDRVVVSFRQAMLDRMGGPAPVGDERASIETRYELAPGSISRTDHIRLKPEAGSAAVVLEFPSFSRGATVVGDGVVFNTGEVASFTATGLQCRPVEITGQNYRSPVGAFNSLIRCEGAAGLDTVLGWKITFRSAANP